MGGKARCWWSAWFLAMTNKFSIKSVINYSDNTCYDKLVHLTTYFATFTSESFQVGVWAMYMPDSERWVRGLTTADSGVITDNVRLEGRLSGVVPMVFMGVDWGSVSMSDSSTISWWDCWSATYNVEGGQQSNQWNDRYVSWMYDSALHRSQDIWWVTLATSYNTVTAPMLLIHPSPQLSESKFLHCCTSLDNKVTLSNFSSTRHIYCYKEMLNIPIHKHVTTLQFTDNTLDLNCTHSVP